MEVRGSKGGNSSIHDVDGGMEAKYGDDGTITLKAKGGTSGDAWIQGFKSLVKQSQNKIGYKIENLEATRILILSGTHGDEKGVSGLTKEKKLSQSFYEEDMEIVEQLKGDPKRNKMTFKVLNMKDFCWEKQDHKELKENVDDFNHTVLIGAFCHSNHHDGDVNMHLAGRPYSQIRGSAASKADLMEQVKALLHEMRKFELELEK